MAKIALLSPQRYFIFTSLPLTRKNKMEIVDLFEDYMSDISYVIDKTDIDSFLATEENKDIVYKNYKLWLSASGVLSLVSNQNVFIDCHELMVDIENQINFFVKTSSYSEALKKLSKDKIIIILGSPGIGKSTISKMIVLYAASKDYTVRYVSNNEISEIKNCLSLDPEKKEIVLLDDFLGQHYVNIKDTQPNELKTLISFIERSKNKKLILNSRVTILNEAAERFILFKSLIEDNESKKYILDLDEMPLEEKAQILYNHVYFNDLPELYFRYLKHNKNYLRIVKHKNYNPRIIEYVTQKKNYSQVTPEKYVPFIIEKLDNPEDVWNDEFRNRLSPNDRMLMTTLYSLSDKTVDNMILEKAFFGRLKSDNSVDTTINHFKEVVLRLNNSLIKNVVEKDRIKISVVNPSINDFLRSQIKGNITEQIAIIDNAVYFEQMQKVILSEEAKEHLIKKLIAEDFFKINTLENSIFYYYIMCVTNYKILNKKIKKRVALSLERAYVDLRYSERETYGSIIYSLFSENYRKFYDLDSIFISADKMNFILQPMHVDDAIRLVNAIIDLLSVDEGDELIQRFRVQLIEKIFDQVRDEVDDEVSEAVSNVLGNTENEIINDYLREESSLLEERIFDVLEDIAYENICEYITATNDLLEISMDDFEFSEMKYYFEVSEKLMSALREQEIDDEREWSRSDSSSTDSQIVAMFER